MARAQIAVQIHEQTTRPGQTREFARPLIIHYLSARVFVTGTFRLGHLQSYQLHFRGATFCGLPARGSQLVYLPHPRGKTRGQVRGREGGRHVDEVGCFCGQTFKSQRFAG